MEKTSFRIRGGKTLSGSIDVNSSKNATMGVLMASLMNKGETVLHNIPQIAEVDRVKEILTSIGVKIQTENRTLKIKTPNKFNFKNLDAGAAKRTRTVIMMIGALAGRVKKFSIPQAGGCELGERTVRPHLYALENFGIKIDIKKNQYEINSPKLKPAEFVLYETGDTVTENAIMAAAQIKGKTVIKMASANYMVQDLCFFLEKLGIKINGIGTSTLEIWGKEDTDKKVEYTISEDPIDAMLFIATAITTNSEIEIKRCPIEFLELELLKLQKMGFKYEISKKYKAKNGRTDLVNIKTKRSKLKALKEKIHAMPFPGINQDNLPFFVPITARAKGETFIHDWTYENRAVYFLELNKLGARVEMIDNHRVKVFGPTKFKNNEVVCPPALRPAAIILVAMLAAKGESILRNIYPVKRGYERIEERLGELGADIEGM